MHSNELHNYGEKTKVEGTTKMECARYGFRIDRKTSIGCFTKNGHDMVVIEDIGLDGNLIGFHLSLLKLMLSLLKHKLCSLAYQCS